MKRLFLIFACAAMVVACKGQLDPTPGPDPKPDPKPDPEPEFVKVTVQAELDVDETKTYMEEDIVDGQVGAKVKWLATDVITVYNGVQKEGKVSGHAYNISEDGTKASFDVTLVADVVRYGMDCIALYGVEASSWAEDGGSKPFSNALNVLLSSSQQYKDSTSFSTDEFPMAGTSLWEGKDEDKKVKFRFKNLCGILKLDIKLSNADKGIKELAYVQLTDNAPNSFLAGGYQLTWDTTTDPPTPMMTYIPGSGGSSQVVEIAVPRNVHNIDDSPFFFILPPGALAGNTGFNLYVYTRDGYYYGKKITPKENDGFKIRRSGMTHVSTGINPVKPDPEALPYTANSYIVPARVGRYSIPAGYKGNGYQGNGADIQPASSENTIPFNPTNYVEILWQTKCSNIALTSTELISSPIYSQVDRRIDAGHTEKQTVISFYRTGQEGNALIALKNASGQILWSWHLWITNDNETVENGVMLKSQVDGSDVWKIMDRNLGALTSDPSAGSMSHGLQYQFGRKDPFMGSCKSFLSDVSGVTDQYACYMVMYPERAVILDTDNSFTVGKSILNPKVRNQTTNNTWSSDGNPSWSTSQSTSAMSPKVLYDPCPVGWRTIEEAVLLNTLGANPSTGAVNRPDGESVSYSGPDGTFYAFKLKNQGTPENKGTPIYLPASGMSESNNNLVNVGTNVCIWGTISASFIRQGAEVSQGLILKINLKGEGDTSAAYDSEMPAVFKRATMPVRCEKWNEPVVVPAAAN
ncbi:MAG: hypothetical protein MJY89_00005 [Bacteroidales bacterium]|nr:hypothetical protein [Bacteroidales bacterium]